MKRFNTVSFAGRAALTSKISLVLLVALPTFVLTTAASAAELVVNGGFEDPVVDPNLGWMTYYGENHDPSEPADCDPNDTEFIHCNDGIRVPGWSVFWTDDIINHEQLNPGRLEIMTGNTGGSPAYDGSLQKAELDSHHRLEDDNNNVTIAQYLPTCPLTAYTLNYAWKSRTTQSGDNDVRVVVGSELVNIHMQNLQWEEETVHFISDNADGTLLLFGSIGDETTTGMFLDEVSVTGPDGSDIENCPLDCTDKPLELTLRYDGDDDTDHNQTSGEVVISPEVVPSYPADATIMVYDHKKKNPEFLGEFDVSIGGFFTVSGPHKRIPPRLTFEIYRSDASAGDDPVQTITFHTSCSQPMDAGDEFGAITVWSAVN